MPRMYEVQLRHSEHYLELLRRVGDLFTQGKESLKSALTQYESESENIDVGYATAERHAGEDSKAAHLCIEYPNAARYLLDFRQQPLERLRWLKAALATSNSLNKYIAKERLLVSFGITYLRLAQNKEATDALESALAIARDIGDRDAEGEALSHLGRAWIDSGQIERALPAIEQSLSIGREVENPRTQCIALNSLGQAHYILREFQLAIGYYTAALHITSEAGYLPEEGITLVNLGKTYAILNRPRKAIETQLRSLLIAREIGDKRSEVRALTSLGHAYHLLGEFEDAISSLRSALPFAIQLGDGAAEADILSLLGDSYLEVDQVELAVDCYRQRVSLTRSLGLSRFLVNEHVLTSERAIQVVESEACLPREAEDQTTEGKSFGRVGTEEPFGSEAETQLISLDESFQIEEATRPASVTTDASAQVGRGTVTWLHLSDLHFQQSSTYDANVVLEPLLEDIAKHMNTEGLSLDFAAITGDIAFSGKPEEYDMARQFFEKLMKVAELSWENLFMVPGNHDVNASLVEPWTKSIGSMITKREKYSELLDSPEYWMLVMRRFQGWSEFFNNQSDRALTFDDDNYFYVKTLDLVGTRIAILGLNSAWLSHPEDDRTHRLVLGERQVRAALKTAKNAGAQIIIAMLHHPYDWLREFDQYYSWEYLSDECNFVLHGHLHRPSFARLATPNNEAMVIAGGACYATREYPNSYNFVRLDLKTNTGIIYFRTYSDNRGGFWAPDTRLYKNVPDGRYEFALPNFGKP